jgi:general stress protein YciG
MEDVVPIQDRGFASMDPIKRREIASKGGRAAHVKGTAHEWTSQEAREAGHKGGVAQHRKRQEYFGGVEDLSSPQSPTDDVNRQDAPIDHTS